MYTAYWNLNTRPFDNEGDRRFYYASRSHQVALLKLRYALDHSLGAAVLSGGPGMGKSLLIESLMAGLPESIRPRVHIKFPQMPPPQLLALIAEELGGKSMEGATVDRSIQTIQRTLEHGMDEGCHALLVIDEAHLLDDDRSLETLRLLTNFEPAWTVFLVAHDLLLPTLERTPGLAERIGMHCLLRPFSLDDSLGYVQHRLAVAGAADVHRVFEPAALEALHRASGGIPRRINRLGDLALLVGFAERQRPVAAVQVAAVSDELLVGGAGHRSAA